MFQFEDEEPQALESQHLQVGDVANQPAIDPDSVIASGEILLSDRPGESQPQPDAAPQVENPAPGPDDTNPVAVDPPPPPTEQDAAADGAAVEPVASDNGGGDASAVGAAALSDSPAPDSPAPPSLDEPV